MKTQASPDYLAVALEAAGAAGQLLMEHYSKTLAVDSESHHDIKLEVDRLAEDAIVSVIRRAFPDHAILAEERGEEKKGGPYTWIIDPLDGTANYAHRYPHFCTSIALRRGEELILGAVLDPFKGEQFIAAETQAPTLNGHRMQVSARSRIDAAFAECGFAKQECTYERNLACLRAILPRARKVRISGSAALSLCYVACGRLDVYVEEGIFLWDLAAGAYLIRQAGGRIDAEPRGDGTYRVVATNDRLHETVNKIILGGD